MQKNILLTGNPGIGKTTIIKRIIAELSPTLIGGFWSTEIRRGSKRIGFAIKTVTGEEGILAHKEKGHGPRFGSYVVNVKDIEEIAIPSMINARKLGKVILIDEIARMELCSPRFASEVVMCLDTKRVLGTIQNRQDDFLNSVKSRIDTQVYTVTTRNRDELPSMILSLVHL
jgi:nucleoside-triphosphatase